MTTDTHVLTQFKQNSQFVR